MNMNMKMLLRSLGHNTYQYENENEYEYENEYENEYEYENAAS